MATHAGMTTEEFEKVVKDWVAAAKHPTTGRLYTCRRAGPSQSPDRQRFNIQRVTSNPMAPQIIK